MTELSKHIDEGRWLKYFADDERGHVLGWLYNIIKWLEEDNADTLELRPKEFVWSKADKPVGQFPITSPDPVPSFQHILLEILDRDSLVQEYLSVISEDKNVFRFKSK